MRYGDQDRESENVEDRRGEGGGFRFPGGMGGGRMGIPIPIGRGGFSITTLLIIGAIMLLFGVNPLDILSGDPNFSDMPQMPRSERTSQRSPADIPGLPGQKVPGSKSDDEMKRFVSRVLADTEDVWSKVFQGMGRRYEEPRLVLFSGGVRTECGTGISAMGPFYCPIDRKLYIDLTFYDELRRRFRAPGDFAQAYVIAHEVGHHVQTILGIAAKVEEEKRRRPKLANQVQVRMELQADCLAGVWANQNQQLKNRLEAGDIEEGLNAAAQIGDDTMQKRTQGQVVPDAFTHGSSEQRVRWFKRGFDAGEMQACDTFSATSL